GSTGIFFGVTGAGGGLPTWNCAGGCGTVFELIWNRKEKRYDEKFLHNFCPNPGCIDGSYPTGTLISDINGNFWGTTWHGGKYNHGTVFELAHNWNWKNWG